VTVTLAESHVARQRTPNKDSLKTGQQRQERQTRKEEDAEEKGEEV